MNIPGTAGESSCKRQENGDVTSGSDRPLKKARFAWQVKGKYHLKNENSDIQKSPSCSRETQGMCSSSETESDSNDLVGNTEQNLEILGDYLLKQDFNTLDSVITDSDKSLLKPVSSVSAEKLSYPRYIPSFDNNSSNISTVDSAKDDSLSIPISMVATQSYNEEQCIARWQTRQMAKGFVDNTINRVLDSWMVAPLPAEMDNRLLALDVADFINNLPGDNSIENEGILMAISAHGLQNTSASSSDQESPGDAEVSATSMKGDIFPSPPSSPMPSDEESFEEKINNHCNEKNDGNDLSMKWSYTNDSKQNIDSDDFSLFPGSVTSSSSYHFFGELQEGDLQADLNLDADMNVKEKENDATSHFDFLDAAVSFAIQNKGLASFGTDYG